MLLAQKINNHWFFGDHAGLDFNSTPPASIDNPFAGADEPPYYTSSISNALGRLLFYTDGHKIWNSVHDEMSRVQDRWPWMLNDAVLPLICPHPGNDSLYYLFSIGKGSSLNAGKLVSLSVNSSSNNNAGNIIYPQPSTASNYYTVHTNNASFLLAGTSHCNQRDTWIVTIANGALHSYLVSSTGISLTPVTTPLLIAQSSLAEGYSNIKFSANGEKLAIPVISENRILVYDFNNQTGGFDNLLSLQLPEKEFLKDVELSPGGSRLYYGSYENQMDGPEYTGVELHNIFQLDLEAGNTINIENSRYRMNDFPDRGGCPRNCYIINRCLQLGPDGKIYISLRDVGQIEIDKKVNVIEFPDQLRENAFYRRNYIDVGLKYKFINVSYIKSGSFSAKENGIRVSKKICLGLPTEFSLLFTKIDSVKWNFGDPGSGPGNSSTLPAPTHNYASIGTYTIIAYIYKNCSVDTAISMVSIDPDPIVKVPAHIKDTIVCVGSTLRLDAGTPAATSYMWNDGLIYSHRVIDKDGDFLVRAYNACSDDQKSFTVRFDACPCEFFVPSAFTPNNNGLNDEFKPLTNCHAEDYQFQIFNRYGNIVFSTKQLSKGWNGNYSINQAPAGVYVWTLQYKDPNNGKIAGRQGIVTLIR